MVHLRTMIVLTTIFLFLVPGVTGFSVKHIGTDTLTGKATAQDAANAVHDANQAVTSAQSSVSLDANTSGSVTGSPVSNPTLHVAKEHLKHAQDALNQSRYNESVSEAKQARIQAVNAQKDSLLRVLNRTQDQVQSFNTTRTRLITVTNLLEGENISMNQSRTALKTSEVHITTAAQLLETAREQVHGGNLTAAQTSVSDASAELREAQKILGHAPIRAEVQAGISAKIHHIASLKAKTKTSVNKAPNTFGTKQETTQAKKHYYEAEKAYEEGQQSKSGVSSAGTLAEMAQSAQQAATTLNTAEQHLQSAQSSAAAAQSLFFRNSMMGALLLAVMGGGGFLYYRMHGGYTPPNVDESDQDETQKNNEKKDRS